MIKFILENFDTIFKNENSLETLKKVILDLAIRGKLVPQNENDEPAGELLKRIQSEKERLIKEKVIKKEKPLPEIIEEEIPFDIPKNWKWVRMIDVLDVRDGTHDTPKYVDKGIPLITSKNIYDGKLDFTKISYISEEDHQKISLRSKVDKNDILFAMIGSIGNPIIVDIEPEFSIKNVALFKYYKKDTIYPKYLLNFLKIAQNDMKKKASGGVQKFVSLGYIRNYLIPLPPLKEQKRIVEKVENLMEICNLLEEKINLSEKISENLLKSLLNNEK